MFVYEKKLQYPVNIKQTNPKLAKIIITQYGGPDFKKIYNTGREFIALCRYLYTIYLFLHCLFLYNPDLQLVYCNTNKSSIAVFIFDVVVPYPVEVIFAFGGAYTVFHCVAACSG